MTTPKPAVFRYNNYKNEVSERRVIPTRIWFGTTEHYPDSQWLMDAFCMDRQAMRTFALGRVVGPADNGVESANVPPEIAQIVADTPSGDSKGDGGEFTFPWHHRQTFGPYLKGLREAKGMSTRVAGTALGISFSYLSQLERGAREAPPSLKMLLRLAATYEEDARTLFLKAGFRLDPTPTVPTFTPEQIRGLTLLVQIRLHTLRAQEALTGSLDVPEVYQQMREEITLLGGILPLLSGLLPK